MTLVVDASAVVAALVDSGPVGTWALEHLGDAHLIAPHCMPGEVANVLRRSASSGLLSDEIASLAHADLLDLRLDLYPYAALATRAWALRGDVTIHDAWYVALAEAVDAPLLTVDHRLTRAGGPRCAFLTPD